MKKIIQKINNYLIERHPLLWNTRIVWFLGVSLLLHLVFFLFGFISLTDVTILHKRSVLNLFLENGTVFFSVIISIVQIVVWLIYLFKNNAFKEFYPVSRGALFLQFLIFFFCFFISTTYYFSYTSGLKTYVVNKYDQNTFLSDVATANDAAMFLSHDLTDYTIDNAKYPPLLDSLYCEKRQTEIDVLKPHISFKKKHYQFYSIKSKEFSINNVSYNKSDGFLFSRRKDSTVIKFYKDSVIDVSNIIKTEKPSFYNYSNIFFSLNKNSNIYGDEFYPVSYENLEYGYYDDNGSFLNQDKFLYNKNGYLLLENKNRQLIEERLTKFLHLMDKFEVPHNLTAKEWTDLVYHPDLFEVSALIRESKNEDSPNYNYLDEVSEATFLQFTNQILTNYFAESRKLHNVLYNIEEISNENIFSGIIHFFLWLSFFLASILFAFRTTGLKPLLFGLILSGILFTLSAFVAVIFDYMAVSYNMLFQYTLLFIGSIIIATPLFFLKNLRKIMQGVFIVITIVGFASYLFLIISIISSLQRNECLRLYDYNFNDHNCFILLEYFGAYTSYIVLFGVLVFLFMYTSIIKKWRALPEK